MAREPLVYGYTAQVLAIPAGASLSRYVTPAPGEIWSRLKYVSGGSLEIMGASAGGMTGIAPAAGTGYIFGTTEIIEQRGAASYFLQATGATAVAHLLRGLSQGF
jgi:hypothetical protein